MNRLRTPGWRRALGIVAMLLGFLLADAAALYGAEGWHRRLGRIEDALAQGRWQLAVERSTSLRAKLIRPVDRGHELLPLAAHTLALQAIAEANLGQEHAARWHWLAAESLLGAPPAVQLFWGDAASEVLGGLSLERLVEEIGAEGLPAGTAEGHRAAAVRVSVRPETPKTFERAGLVGAVVVEVVVDRRGRPRGARVLEPGPVPTLAVPVLEALRQWSFTPAHRDGQPLPVRMRLRIAGP